MNPILILRDSLDLKRMNRLEETKEKRERVTGRRYDGRGKELIPVQTRSEAET